MVTATSDPKDFEGSPPERSKSFSLVTKLIDTSHGLRPSVRGHFATPGGGRNGAEHGKREMGKR